MILQRAIIIALIITACISISTALLLWRRRTMPGTIPVFFIMLGVVVWSVTYALELMIDDMSSKILFMKLQYLGITTIPTMWLSSVLQHTGLNKRLSKRYRIPLLSIMPVITLVLVFTNEYHGLIWKEITLNVDGPFPLTNLAHGKWFWTYLSYSHLMLLFSTILIINAVIHSLETYRKHGITILIGTFAPWIGNALYISGLTPHHIDLSPFAFSLTGIAAAWGMSHFHLFDILPVARDMVIKSMNNPVIVLDMEDNIIYINPAARDIIRSLSISPIGQSITDIPQFQSTSLRQYLEKTEVYTEISMDIAVEKRYFELQVQPLINKFENQIGRFFVLRDITERKKAEEELKIYQEHLEEMVKERTTELKDINDQLQREVIERKRMEEELIRAEKLEAVSVLAGGIAHDFNNILTAILGNVSLAKLYIDSENKAFDRLTDTEKAVDRAVELTKKLITFASGGAPVVKPVSIKELLIEAANFCMQGSNVKCVLSIPDDIWQVEIDEGQIGQVISNIVINARQSMPNGGTINLYAENIVLEEDIETLLKNERFVRISIQDQGTGISNDILNRIFEPYFTTKEGGAGLGLAISYSIIKKHGGNITVESYQGIGTTFHIYLPVFAKEIPEEEKRLWMKWAADRRKIMVMDDEEMIRDYLKTILNKLGHEVTLARDGSEAIRLYNDAIESGHPYDVIIMDLTVHGGMGGKEAIQKIRLIDPEVKAIVSSGYFNDPVMSDFRKYGFVGFILKPYNVGELIKVLNNIRPSRSSLISRSS